MKEWKLDNFKVGMSFNKANKKGKGFSMKKLNKKEAAFAEKYIANMKGLHKWFDKLEEVQKACKVPLHQFVIVATWHAVLDLVHDEKGMIAERFVKDICELLDNKFNKEEETNEHN